MLLWWYIAALSNNRQQKWEKEGGDRKENIELGERCAKWGSLKGGEAKGLYWEQP